MMAITKFGITFYTTKEAVEMIGRSKTTVFGWIRSKKIKDVKKNQIGHREWLESDIKRFAEFAKNNIDKTKNNK
jgi:hypothetical protein